MKQNLEKTLNSPYFFIATFVIFAFVQLFMVDIFFHDKNIVASQISHSIADGNILGKSIPCFNQDGSHSVLKKWAEEPPIYHILTSIFYISGLDMYYYRFFGISMMLLLSSILTVTYYQLFKKNDKKDFYFILSTALIQPYVFIFATRPMPDILSLIFLVLFVYFFIKRNYKLSFAFSLLAVTTKVLAIFPIFFFILAYFLLSKRNNFTERLLISSTFGLSIVPFIVWMLFLKYAEIPNPFISSETDNAVHTGYFAGVEEVVIYTRRFWTRVLSYTSLRGISIPLFLCFLLYLKNLSSLEVSKFRKFLLPFLVLGHLFYILIVSSPQVSAPWYSFYFLPFYFWGAMFYLKDKSHSIKALIFIFMFITSISFARYTTPKFDNIKVDILSIGAAVKCDFHDVNR